MRKGLVLAFLAALPAWSGDWTGYLKNYSFAADPAPGTMSADHSASSSTRLRLQYRKSRGQGWSIEAAGETAWTVQQAGAPDHPLFMTAARPFGYRISDPDHRFFPVNGNADTHQVGTFNLDRLSVRWSGDETDVTAGRQAIAWGSAKMVNPTDILAPYAFTELDTEYRVGVDAIRIRHAFNALSELDTGYVFGPGGGMSKSALFLRGKTYLADTDAAVTLMRFREHLMVGLDLARAWGGTGTWLEAAIVQTNRFDKNAEQGRYLRLSVGADRQLTPTVYGFLEYHFNGAGAGKKAEYLDRRTRPAYTEGGVYLLGRQYLDMGLNIRITPLTTLNSTVILNLRDASAFLTARLTHSLSDNIDASLGVYLKTGREPAARPRGGILPGSFDEFGAYPGLVYASLRWYF